MSLNIPKNSHSYQEFENYFQNKINKISSQNQIKIILIKEFFDTGDNFMSALEQAYQVYNNSIKTHPTASNITSTATKKGRDSLYRSMEEYNLNKLSYFRDKSILEQELYSVIKEYRLFIENKEKENKSKKEEIREDTSAKVSNILESKNHAARHHDNARIIDWNVYTPYTTPEEIENKERREEERNKNTTSFDFPKKGINDPKKVSIKKDKLWQLYMDFFAEEEEEDSDK